MYFRPGVTKQKSLIKKKSGAAHLQWFFILYILSWIEIWSNTVVGGENYLLQGEKLLRKYKKKLLHTECTCEKGISNHTQAIEKEGKFPMASSWVGVVLCIGPF